MGRSQADVVATAVVAVLACGAAAIGAPAAVQAPLGILLFAACGYLLSELLLGGRIAGLERVAVATGLALAVPILGGPLLYAAGVLLHQAAWLGLLAGVALASDLVLFARRRAGRAELFSWRPEWRRPPRRQTAIFAAAIVVAACGVGLARVGVSIQPQTGFTQLWLSPQAQNARAASLGVTNNQGSVTSYRLVLLSNGHVSATWNLTLDSGRTWQRAVPLTGNSTLTVNLYRLPDLTHPYRYVATGPVRAAGS
jgi:hypothetical protein